MSGNRAPAWPGRGHAITAEERMLELRQRQKALAAGVYDGNGNAAAFDAADIERLFEPFG